MPYYNEQHIHSEIEETPEARWKRAMKENRSYLKSIPPKTPLDTIFSIHYIRKLNGAGRFTLQGLVFTIPKAPRYKNVTLILQPPYGPRQTKTRLTVLYKGSTLKQFILIGKRILNP